MLDESGMEEKFCAEAASTAVYLINRSPSSAIEYRGLKHLRRFGCAAYVHTVGSKTSVRVLKGSLLVILKELKGSECGYQKRKSERLAKMLSFMRKKCKKIL